MKETREQYQERKRAQFARRQEYLKRRQERINKRKAEALEQAKADYAKNRHILPSEAKAMKADALIDKYINMDPGVDRHEVIAVEIVRRARKYARATGIQFDERKPDHGFQDEAYVMKCAEIVKNHISRVIHESIEKVRAEGEAERQAAAQT